MEYQCRVQKIYHNCYAYPKIKILSAGKPDPVVGYHLSGRIITDTILLPTLRLGRAALKRRFTWHFSTQGLPENIVTNTFRELLPHIFTLVSVYA
jgi:hypothetical protein